MSSGVGSWAVFTIVAILPSCLQKPTSQNAQNSIPTMSSSTQPGCRVLERDVAPWSSSDKAEIFFQCHRGKGNVVTRTECRFGGSGSRWELCDETKPFLAESHRNGQKIFEVRAHYENGEVVQSAPYVWKVDSYPPSILNVDREYSEDKHSIRYRVEAVDSGGSGLAYLECLLKPLNAWSQCPAEISFDRLEKNVEYVFKVRAVDQAGNFSSVFVDEAFQVQRIPAAISTGPFCAFQKKPVKWVRQRDLTISFECFNSQGKTTASLCKLDDLDWEPCLSDKHHRLRALSLGKHSLKVRPQETSRDQASQEEDVSYGEVEYEFVVDDLAPLTVITHAQTEGLTPSFAFVIDEDLTPVREAQCQVESHNRVLKKWHPCQSPFTVSSGLQPHVDYVLKVRGVDSAGNVGDFDSRSWEAKIQRKPVCLTLHQGKSVSINEEQLKVDFYCHGPKPIKAFECRSNHGEWRDCASSKFDILERSNDENKLQSFQVRGQDNEGVWGEPSLPYRPE